MNRRFLNGAIIVTSLCGYLEWGKENHTFLFQAEAEVLSKLLQDPLSVAHPLTLLPLFGQVLLLITLFQKKPSKVLTFMGLGCLGLLLFFISFIGIISFNWKIFLSTIPFVITAILAVKMGKQ